MVSQSSSLLVTFLFLFIINLLLASGTPVEPNDSKEKDYDLPPVVRDRYASRLGLSRLHAAKGEDRTKLLEQINVAARENRLECKWEGTAPFCSGECEFGAYVIASDDSGDGRRCTTGKKVYCCSV